MTKPIDIESNVKLIDYTGHGTPDPARHAANLLVFTKNTRLEMKPGGFEEVQKKPWSEIEDQLKYMANTIPSSWEFVGYTFLITDVTRGFTHQLVRTRTASFAQQTMRVLDVSGFTYGVGPTVGEDEQRMRVYGSAMETIGGAYQWLISNGAKIEDARGVLPTNIHTNIVCHMNLRTLADMFRKRASSRTQGEYRDIAEQMKRAVMEAHPWTELFITQGFDKAAADLEAVLLEALEGEEQTAAIKLLDQLRMNA